MEKEEDQEGDEEEEEPAEEVEKDERGGGGARRSQAAIRLPLPADDPPLTGAGLTRWRCGADAGAGHAPLLISG